MKLLIIGGDAAGMSAASQAKRLKPETEVTVLEMTQDVSYGACGLPYKIPGEREMDDLQIITAERFREERGIDVRLGHRVTRILREQRRVQGEGPDGPFELPYDKLLIATGARVKRPPIAGLDAVWGKGAYPLKTLQDGRELKAALLQRPPRRAIVIGAGYIGLETTEGLVERGIEVTIVEALPTLLPFLPPKQQERVADAAKRHDVALHLATMVERIERCDDGTMALETSAGTLKADIVVVATGVVPSAELAVEAGLELGAAGSIAVDEYLYTSDPHILAAGDCADARHAISGASVWFPLALRANRAGKLAGFNAFERTKPAPPVMGTAVFKFLDMEIARAGLSQEEADQAGLQTASAEILGSTRAHYYPGGGKLSVWLLGDKATGKLVGATMVGPEAAAHKIDTAVVAMSAGLTAAQLYDQDLAYAPPFGPSWSPLLIAASKLGKALGQ